ncbi:MAG TPA: flagellar biosynthesis protein FlgN [Hyphomicrobiaceae bacterium]|nr:flagellar biosynthesis protein FlgN [Hyphomicrobiaceae bacterium]
MSNASAAALPADFQGYGTGGPAFTNGAWSQAGGRTVEEGQAATSGHLEKVIERLEAVVESETAALRDRVKADFNDFNHRKSLGLLELSRAMRHQNTAMLGDAVRKRLERLRVSLETNRAMLKLHLEAVREIAAIVSEAIQNAESDGTYAPVVKNGQNRP